jgi:hypothetical protein
MMNGICGGIRAGGGVEARAMPSTNRGPSAEASADPFADPSAGPLLGAAMGGDSKPGPAMVAHRGGHRRILRSAACVVDEAATPQNPCARALAWRLL